MMISTMACVLVLTMNANEPDTATQRTEAAIEFLKQHKAKHGEEAIGYRPSTWNPGAEELEKEPFAFVMIGVDWTGGVDGLAHLKNLPQLRSVLFSHGDVNDKWCDFLADCPQAE